MSSAETQTRMSGVFRVEEVLVLAQVRWIQKSYVQTLVTVGAQLQTALSAVYDLSPIENFGQVAILCISSSKLL